MRQQVIFNLIQNHVPNNSVNQLLGRSRSARGSLEVVSKIMTESA